EAGGDLDIDGELEDDWGVVDDEEEEAADDPLLAEYMQKMGYSPLEEEEEEQEEDEDQMPDIPLPPKIQERVDKAKARLEQFADPESLKAFDGVGGGGGEAIGWLEVPLNDTFSVFVSQVPGAANRFQEMLRGAPEVTNITTDILQSGDTVWPASIILARWLAIQPPVVSMEGLSVLEFGSGLGLGGVACAGFGARAVLLQDRDPECLRQAVETAVRSGVAQWITTLRCDYNELPAKLASGKEALREFAPPDVFVGCDVLLNQASVQEIVSVLNLFLRSPSQVAYFMDPYTRPHRKLFMQYCDSMGLVAKEDEIVTWEPDWENPLEYDREWVDAPVVATALLVGRMIIWHTVLYSSG
ncbi:Mettl23, partial [Symbiodinium sp. KB8]